MKKTLSFLGALSATALILSSCGGDDPVTVPFLTVKDADGKAPAATVSFSAAAGSKTFTVESNGSWSISKPSTSTWLTVNPSSGTGNKTVSISAETCAEITARTAVLKFILDGTEKVSFTVQQSAAEPYLNIKDAENKAAGTTLAFEAAAGEVTYTLESNAAWSVTGATEWLKVVPASGSNNGTVKVSAAASTSFDPRTATLKFLMGTTEKLAVAVTQVGIAPLLEVTQSYGKVQNTGGEVTFTINTNLTDLQSGLGGAAWLTVKSSTATQLVLTAATNTTLTPRSATVQFTSAAQPSLNKSFNIEQTLFADMIDVEFKADGTAQNIAPSSVSVETIVDPKMTVYRNSTYDRFAARFTHDPGGSSATGVYKIDFSKDEEFKNALIDGHSLECLFMANFEPGGAEVKPFGAHEGGGTGILVCNSARQNNISFLPNTDKAWRWALSGVKPVVGTFYHVVGVYDKDAGKAYTYINGELKGTGDAPGNYTMPGPTAQWFAVGGDAAGNGIAGNLWNGDVVTARVYDAPLTAGDVKVLWERVSNPQ